MNLATTLGNLLLILLLFQPFHQYYYYAVVVVVLQVESLNFKHQTKTTSFMKLICFAPVMDKILVFKTPKSSSSSSSNQIFQAFPKSRLFSFSFCLLGFVWFVLFCTYFVFIYLFSGFWKLPNYLPKILPTALNLKWIQTHKNKKNNNILSHLDSRASLQHGSLTACL